MRIVRQIEIHHEDGDSDELTFSSLLEIPNLNLQDMYRADFVVVIKRDGTRYYLKNRLSPSNVGSLPL